jgi:hypothetical protein
MENINIQGSRKVPTVLLNPRKGVFELKGNSIPEDAGKFYQPIVDKLEEYFGSPHPVTQFNIHLLYYNTSTSKWLLNIFRLAKKYMEMGHEINIKWYYDEDDEVIQEAVLDYEKILEVPIQKQIAS